MLHLGGLEEVSSFLELEVPTDKPATKAIGVPQLSAHLAGDLSMSQAIEQAQAASRQYAKRQYTWFRNQFGSDWQTISSPDEYSPI